MDMFRFASTCVIKKWRNPDDREEGIDVYTTHGYHTSRKQARKSITEMHEHPDNEDAIQFLGFITPIEMVVQDIKA